MEKYKTIFEQMEEENTEKAYEDMENMYKNMTFEEVINIANELHAIASLMATNTHEFKHLNTNGIAAIANELQTLQPIGECLSTIAHLRNVKNIEIIN